MAKQRHRHADLILEKLMDGWHPKAIAAFLNCSYDTVITLKNTFFKTVLVLKDHIPDRDQGHFFNWWRE